MTFVVYFPYVRMLVYIDQCVNVSRFWGFSHEIFIDVGSGVVGVQLPQVR